MLAERFILPHHKGLRPGWLIRLGLFIYDHLGGRRGLPASGRIGLKTHPAGTVLSSAFSTAFIYSDCWVEDSLLVVLNAVDASRRGAVIRTRTKLVSAEAKDGHWQLITQPESGPPEEVSCRMLVNAAGPWAADILHRTGTQNNKAALRLIKGSHLIVNRQLPTQDAFLLQNSDGRITFLIPYEDRFTLIGTTDVDVQMSELSSQMTITDTETEYLLKTINGYLKTHVSRSEIVASYAGVRPLYDDGSGQAAKANRDYHLEASEQDGAPLLSVFGGKLTTYRRLAETALKEINAVLNETRPAWTAHVPLPGGDFTRPAVLEDRLKAQISDMPEQVARRLVRAYGTDVFTLAADATCLADLGQSFGEGLSEAELRYMMAHEYARTADDILMRRSKLYLHLTDKQKQHLDSWLSSEQQKQAN